MGERREMEKGRRMETGGRVYRTDVALMEGDILAEWMNIFEKGNSARKGQAAAGKRYSRRRER